MTDETGKVLPMCEVKMQLLDAQYKSLGTEVGSLRQTMDRLAGHVAELSGSFRSIQELPSRVDALSSEMGRLAGSFEEFRGLVKDDVMPALRGMSSLAAASRKAHESECAFFQALSKKDRNDITQRILASKPPGGDDKEIKRLWWTAKTKLLTALATLLTAAAFATGAFVERCEGGGHNRGVKAAQVDK
jgi:hypothetical protein